MVKCYKCGQDNPSSNKFCEDCGSTLKGLNCRKCGNKLNPKHQFCEQCGAKSKNFQIESNGNANFYIRFKWWLIASALVLLFGVIFVFFIPISYSAIEGYTEKSPIMQQENYNENETTLLFDQIVGTKDTIDFGPAYVNYLHVRGSSELFVNINSDTPVRFSLITDSACQDKNAYYDVWWLEENLISKSFKVGYVDGQDLCMIIQGDRENIKIFVKITGIRAISKIRNTISYYEEYKERNVTKYATIFQQLTGQTNYYQRVE